MRQGESLDEFLRTMERIFREPLAVEAFFALLLTLAVVLLVRSLRGVAGRLSRRKALREFVGGVDLAFKGEFEEARKALALVLERDPENSEARILLGDACRELGDLAEAHKHHYQVAEVFGRDLPRNRLSLGRDLLLMGRPADAIAHLERAAAAEPDDAAIGEHLLESYLGAGRLGDAVGMARRLEEAARGDGLERARRRRATVCVLAGREHVRRGEVREGLGLFRTALKLNPSLVAPRLEIVRTSWLNGSARAAEKELVGQLKEMARLAEEGDVVFEPPSSLVGAEPEARAPAPRAADGAAVAELPAPPARALPAPGAAAELPAPAGTGALAVERAAPGPPVAADAAEMPEASPLRDAGAYARALLPREAIYLCSSCGRGERVWRESCPGCGSFGALLAADTTLLAPVEGMKEIYDEILENRAHLRRLVGLASTGDEEACRRLVKAGPPVVGSIFREILRTPDHASLVRVLSAMGPGAVAEILSGYRRMGAFSTKRLVREGMGAFRSLDGTVVMALAGMGDDVLPELAPLLESPDRADRAIALDVLIRLGQAQRIEAARLEMSPKEILDRLNACPEEDLGALLDACAAEGFLADRILADRTFGAERALVRALGRAGNRRKMRGILIRRGFSAAAYESLEEVWPDPDARVIVRDVVRSYGRAAADHLLRTYTNPNLPEHVREDALGLFLDLGEEEIERLVEQLADGDPETEKAVLRGVAAFGSRAVPALVRAYGRSGLLEKVGLNRRRLQYRKMTLLRALAQIGTYDAIVGLRQLHDREGDGELKRRILGVIERLSGKGGAA